MFISKFKLERIEQDIKNLIDNHKKHIKINYAILKYLNSDIRIDEDGQFTVVPKQSKTKLHRR